MDDDDDRVQCGRVGGVGYYCAAAVIVVSPVSLFCGVDVVRGQKQGAPRAIDDEQTNSVLFHLSVWPSTVVPSQRMRTVRGSRSRAECINACIPPTVDIH